MPIWEDVLAMMGAFFLFPVLFLLPGYAIGMATNALQFRETDGQGSKSILLSMAISPWLIYILMRYINLSAVWVFIGLCCVISLVYVIIQLKNNHYLQLFKPASFLKLLILCAVVISVGLMLVDLKDSGRLIRPLMSHDYVKHFTVTSAISRTGLPPVNPSLYVGEGLPLFYYYFWFMLCSVIDLLGGALVDVKAAVYASVIWAGLGLCAVVNLFLNINDNPVVRGIMQSSKHLGFVLLLITGLDIIPIGLNSVMYTLVEKPVLPDVLWWNDIISSWIAAVLWVPHHIGAFVICMLAFLLIIYRSPQHRFSIDTSFILIALCLASSLGLSIWVTIVAAWCLVVWFVFTLYQRWMNEAQYLFLVGVVSILFAIPFILDIQQANNLDRFPIALHVRPFYNLDITLANLHPALLHFVNFLLLPLNYLIELGFFILGGILYLKYRAQLEEKLNRSEWFALLLLASSLFFCTFFRSAIINNDLGWRGIMFTQFVLLLYSVPVLSRMIGQFTDERLLMTQTIQRIGLTMITLSVMLTMAELYIRRYYAWGPSGRDTIAIREAYEWIDDSMNQDAIVQHNPEEHIEYFHGLYGNRQVVVSDKLHGRLYGISDSLFEATYEPVAALFEDDLLTEERLRYIEQYQIDALFLKTNDLAWHQDSSWLSTYPLVYESSCCRIYAFTPAEELLLVDAKP